jgi:tRNA(His) 5'-end guanylyltransferase
MGADVHFLCPFNGRETRCSSRRCSCLTSNSTVLHQLIHKLHESRSHAEGKEKNLVVDIYDSLNYK